MLAGLAQGFTPPVDVLVAPEATEALQLIADAIQPVTPGRTVVLPGTITVNGPVAQEAHWPELFRLPCRDCGYVFWSRPRRGRLSRTCGDCFEYEARAVDHPRARTVLHQEGFGYRSRRASEPTIFVDAFGVNVLCAHPDCLRSFVASKPNSEYCEAHRRDHRQTLSRLRAEATPKHERYRFRLPQGIEGKPSPVNVADTATGPVAQLRQQEWTRAHNEPELGELAALAERGLLVAERVTDLSGD